MRPARLIVALAAAIVLAAAPVRAAEAPAAPAGAAEKTPEQKLLELVGHLRQDGRLAEARKVAEQGLAVAEKDFGPNDIHAARWLTQLGLTCRAAGQYAEAERHLKRALAIYEKTLGVDAAETGQAAADLGWIYSAMGRYGEAESLLKRALAIAEKTRGPKHADTAASLTLLGTLYVQQGRLKEAEPLLVRALAIDETLSGPSGDGTASSLINLAELYREQGRFAEAEPLYKRAIAIDEKEQGPDSLSVAIDLSDLALLYQNAERFSEAEPLYRRALDIREKKLGDHPDTATSLSNLATLLMDQGRFGEAEPLLKRALAISEKTPGPDHPDTALSANNLAALYRAQGRRAEARPLYERALAIFEKTLGPEDPMTALALNNLGEIYSDDGRLADAERMFKRALAINGKRLPSEHPDMLATTANLAGVCLLAGRYAEAEQLFRGAIAAMERSLPADHSKLGLGYFWLARALIEQKRYDDAFAAGARATEILSAVKTRATARELGGGWRDEFVYDHVFLLQARVAYALGLKSPAALAAMRAEGFKLLQNAGFDDTARAVSNMASRFAARNDALAGLLREQRDLLRRLVTLDRRLADALGAADPAARAQAASLRSEAETVSARLKEIDTILRRDHKAYADLADPQPVPLTEAQDLLKDDEAVVMIVPLEEATFLFAFSRAQAIWTVAEVTNASLTETVSGLRRQLDPDQWRTRPLEPFDRAAAHKLYRDLWAPLEGVTKDKTHVFVVTTGPLTSLPLAVLVTEEPKGGIAGDADPNALRDTAWLIKRHALTTLPSISSLKALRLYAGNGTGSEPFAGFGDPALSPRASNDGLAIAGASRSVASVFRGAELDVTALRALEALPKTAGELRALAKALGASETADVYLRERATEGRLKSLDLSKKRVIAFATHGLTAGDIGLGEPGLVFTPPAEPNERDDGYLAASEAAALNLKADWIILSACNTAAGDAPGAKGLSGLARAFFLAGAKSLLVSHWPVWDDVAMKLTTGAVANMAKTPAAGRAEALRQAELAVMSDTSAARFAHPAAWAPFVLVGETRAN